MKDLYIVGAGGFGRTVAQIVREINQDREEFNICGFVDDNPSEKNNSLAQALDIPIIGSTDTLAEKHGYFVIASGNGATRKTLAAKIKPFGVSPATLVHPTAQVGSTASIGPGSILSLGAIVTTEVSTGAFCLHNIYSLVSHDCVLGDFVTLSPFAAMLGGSTCGDGAWLSTRSTLSVNTRLGTNSVLGAHALALKDVPDDQIAKGTPARWETIPPAEAK